MATLHADAHPHETPRAPQPGPPGLPDFLQGLATLIGARSVLLRDAHDRMIAQSAPSAPSPGSRALLLRIPSHAGDLQLCLDMPPGGDSDRLRSGAGEAAIRAITSAYLSDVDWAPAAAARDTVLGAALEHNECGIVALDEDHRILFTNAAADAILADRDGIELRRDVPRPTSYHHAVRFQEALDSVMAPSPRRGRPRAMVLLLERANGQRPLIAVLAPVASERQQAACPGAVVYLMRPERSVDRGLDTICQLHGLSPVEAQLVGHLMAGLTVAEAATAMRVKADTARAYLKQVFVKTDTHRQAELLQLMLRYQRAVRGDFAFFPG